MVTPSPYFCASCGYTLTGLRKIGSCPECGAVYSIASGRGVRMQPHQMHVVNDRAKATLGLVFHAIVAGVFWLLALLMVTYFSPKEYPLWLLVFFLIIGLNSAVRVIECRRDLKKLEGV